jgi:hypothetical protein
VIGDTTSVDEFRRPNDVLSCDCFWNHSNCSSRGSVAP